MFTPQDEYDRIRAKYPPLSARWVAGYVIGFAVTGIATAFRYVDPFVSVGLVAAIIGFEFTKFRLRRNARDFARSSASATAPPP